MTKDGDTHTRRKSSREEEEEAEVPGMEEWGRGVTQGEWDEAEGGYVFSIVRDVVGLLIRVWQVGLPPHPFPPSLLSLFLSQCLGIKGFSERTGAVREGLAQRA